MQPPKTYIPRGISEIIDQLGYMMLKSPTFKDRTGYFPDDNIDKAFYQLNEGLKLIKKKIGDDIYNRLIGMSAQMRGYFEADPEDKTDDSLKGREIIDEMITLLRQSRRRKN